MRTRRWPQQWFLALLVATLLSASTNLSVSAHNMDPYYYAPSQGDVNGYYNSSYGFNSIDSWMIWQSSDRCQPDSKLYAFCTGDTIFEHEVWLSNYQSLYPQEYRWSSYPQGYNTSLPGTTYLDTQASDPSGEMSFTVGTLDGDQLSPYTWYYANIIAQPDYPGPNYLKLRIQTPTGRELMYLGRCISLEKVAQYSLRHLQRCQTLNQRAGVSEV